MEMRNVNTAPNQSLNVLTLLCQHPKAFCHQTAGYSEWLTGVFLGPFRLMNAKLKFGSVKITCNCCLKGNQTRVAKSCKVKRLVWYIFLPKQLTETDFILSRFAPTVASWQFHAGTWGKWWILMLMEKCLLLAHLANKSIQNISFPCTLPWKLIKHGIIQCLPLVWIGWSCCPVQADGADVRKNRKSPVLLSDKADSPTTRVEPSTRTVFGFIRSSEQTNTCVYKPLPAPGPGNPSSSWVSELWFANSDFTRRSPQILGQPAADRQPSQRSNKGKVLNITHLFLCVQAVLQLKKQRVWLVHRDFSYIKGFCSLCWE